MYEEQKGCSLRQERGKRAACESEAQEESLSRRDGVMKIVERDGDALL